MKDWYSFSDWAGGIANAKYCHVLADGTKERWHLELAHRVAFTVLEAIGAPTDVKEFVRELIAKRIFMPGGRYLYATGRPYHQTQNCVLNRVQDSREGWSEVLHKDSMALMTGAGIGNTFGLVRPKGTPILKTGGEATGPLALMQMINEVGRGVMQGGARRSAIWAGLPWWHPDVKEFIGMKDWSENVKRMKSLDFNFPATMDMTNISVQLDDTFFDVMNGLLLGASAQYHQGTWKTAVDQTWANEVYWSVIRQMLSTSEPGFSIDVGENAGEELRNACTEVTSRDDSDICNLGSINLARIESLEQFKQVMEVAVLFLLAGTVYSDVPYEKIEQVRRKNRRLGLGLMGVHEWLLLRGKRYDVDAELQQYLEVYATSTDVAARLADQYRLSRPVKTRAIAPTGTIGIVAETTTGIEPMFCKAYKRRFLDGGQTWAYKYVIDPTAKRVVEELGAHPDDIEDAYTLSRDVERRVRFQAWMQEYVDHAISSTINLPAWGSPENNEDTVKPFGEMLLKYLPKLRGITCYADGSRMGQPLNPVPLGEALAGEGQKFFEAGQICDITKGGSCGE